MEWSAGDDLDTTYKCFHNRFETDAIIIARNFYFIIIIIIFWFIHCVDDGVGKLDFDRRWPFRSIYAEGSSDAVQVWISDTCPALSHRPDT